MSRTTVTPIHITDPADPRLDDIRDLNHSDRRPDLPGGKGLVISEGLLVTPRLIESRFPVRTVVGFPDKVKALLDDERVSELLAADDAAIYTVDRDTLKEVAGFDMHRGLVACAARAPELPVADIIAQSRTLMVLEGVGDHENIGAIFRNAAGMHVDGVLFGAACADPLFRRSVRVSMGQVLRLPFATLPGTTTTWQRSLDMLHDAGFHTVAMTPADDATELWEAMDHDKVAIVVGAEGPGLTRHAMRACSQRAKIPMAPGTDSLNVATAAAIACYERLRFCS